VKGKISRIYILCIYSFTCVFYESFSFSFLWRQYFISVISCLIVADWDDWKSMITSDCQLLQHPRLLRRIWKTKLLFLIQTIGVKHYAIINAIVTLSFISAARTAIFIRTGIVIFIWTGRASDIRHLLLPWIQLLIVAFSCYIIFMVNPIHWHIRNDMLITYEK